MACSEELREHLRSISKKGNEASNGGFTRKFIKKCEKILSLKIDIDAPLCDIVREIIQAFSIDNETVTVYEIVYLVQVRKAIEGDINAARFVFSCAAIGLDAEEKRANIKKLKKMADAMSSSDEKSVSIPAVTEDEIRMEAQRLGLE